MNDLESLLASDGPLSRALEGYEERASQQDMLSLCHKAYEEKEVALIEAGTGTGKSLAYLIPAIFWALEHKEATVISTHTIALQEQLLNKDIPFLLKALDVSIKAVLVKGMNNYLCLRKLEDASFEKPQLGEQERKEIDLIEGWAEKTIEGSRSGLPIVPSRSTWERVSAEKESCTHVKCPHYKECFFFKARKEAEEAQLLIVNHHLLFADLSVRRENKTFNQPAILPAYARLVIDEAHHTEDVATEYFGSHVSRLALVQLLGRLLSDRRGGKLVTLRQKILEVFPEGNLEVLTHLDLDLPGEKREMVESIDALFEKLSHFLITLRPKEEKLRFRETHLSHPFWIDEVQPAVRETLMVGERFIASVVGMASRLTALNDTSLKQKCEGILAEIDGITFRIENQLRALKAFAFEPEKLTQVKWIEGKLPNIHLRSAELEIADILRENLFAPLDTTILCSATLAANRDFSFIKKRLGIGDALEEIFESPFDYKEQTLFTVPTDLPDPSSPGFVTAAAEAIWKAIETSRGDAFVLFTSYTMLRSCEAILRERLKKKKYPLLCQGEESRSQLLDSFRKKSGSVLFGTDSFWEGVDVVGDALRLVVIVKLPFKVPSEPLVQARSERIQSEGGSAFADYSLPMAIVKFKQGFGRLIRNKKDRGCVICLDPRLVNKGYGKKFIKSLPPCSVTSEDIYGKMKRFYAASSRAS